LYSENCDCDHQIKENDWVKQIKIH